MKPEVEVRKNRAEHNSVAKYLSSALSPEQLSNTLLISFTHWDFALSALADISLSLMEMNSQVIVAFWANETPLHDVGWSTSKAVSTVLMSPARDTRVRKALIGSGLPKSAFIKPPIRRWKPVEAIELPKVLNRSNIRQMQYRGTPVGRAILQVHPDADTPTSDSYLWPRKWVEATAHSYAYVYDQTLAAIESASITSVFVYNGRFLHDRAVAAAAETRGIPVLNYDTGGSQTDFDLTSDPTHDWIALQNRMLKMYDEWPSNERDEIGSSWFLERVNHEDPLNALFVEAQRKGSRVELPDAERIVVFFSSSGDEIAELELNWDAYFQGQENALKILSEECSRRPGYSLVVRSHPHKRMKPKQDVADWLEAVKLADPGLHLDPFADADSYELMRQADIIVTYGSTTGVEAAFAKKPVIVMGPCAYDHLGCAIAVTNVKELSSALESAEAGSWAGAVSYGLMMKRRGFTYMHVKKARNNQQALSGITFRNANKLTLNLSHLLNRARCWWLTRQA